MATIDAAIDELRERFSKLDSECWRLGYAIDDTEYPQEDAPDPQFHEGGRPPRMTYMRWELSQGVEMGATARRAWYWRHPRTRAWCGPYWYVMDAKHAALDYDHQLWRESRRAAR